MSQAFVKEGDQSEDLPERPVPPGPNYITPRGLELIQEEGRRLAEKKKNAKPGEDVRPVDRDLRYLAARIESAVVVAAGSGEEVRFGAEVTLEEEDGRAYRYSIVGEDEARTDPKFLPWSAPLAAQMFGLKAGQEFSWTSEKGPLRYKIVAVKWE
jgi:transcription elongation factor GreB